MNTSAGKTALITGASSGIGLELAKLFAKDGYNLVLVARSDDKLQQLADGFKDDYGIETTVIGKDLSEEDAAQDVYNQVQDKGLTINVLVNDAGVGTYGKFAGETDWEREKGLIHLNVLTTTQMTKLFLKDMVERNEGKILNLASLVSVTPFPLMAVYAATKAYVYNFTQSLVNELKDTKVTVTALLPNATNTDFFNKAGATNIRATDQVDDPAMVAKDGYKALMAGESKVVPGGLVNKMYEVMAYVAPQEAVAAMMRYNNEPKAEPKEQPKEENAEKSSNSSALAWGLGIAAVAVAGVALAVAYSNSGVVDKWRYKYKLGKLKWKANRNYNNVSDEAGDLVSEASKVVSNGLDNLRQTVARAVN